MPPPIHTNRVTMEYRPLLVGPVFSQQVGDIPQRLMGGQVQRRRALLVFCVDVSPFGDQEGRHLLMLLRYGDMQGGEPVLIGCIHYSAMGDEKTCHRQAVILGRAV
jgi:hypothetical protein